MSCCRPFLFFFLLLACSLIFLPAGLWPYTGIFFLFVLFLSMKQQLPSSCCLSSQQQLSSCCLVRATGICSSPARMLFFLQPLSDILASHSSEHLSFVLLCLSLLLFFSLLVFLFFVMSGCFWCVLVPGTLALHLTYLDELRLFGLLCFTVCDHRNLYLSRMKNQHGLWVS